MKRLIAFISILLLVSMASGTAVSVTIYGTNKSNAQTNVTCYGCNNTISVQAWNTSYVKNISVNTVNASGDVVSFNISNITAFQVQELKVNGTVINGYRAGANGMLNFTYTLTGNKTFVLSPAQNVNGYNMTWAYVWNYNGATPSLTKNGNYTGDNTQNRAIPHGLGYKPNIIFLEEDITGGANFWANIDGTHFYEIQTATVRTVTAADGINFYVGIATPFNTNIGTRAYYWRAI